MYVTPLDVLTSLKAHYLSRPDPFVSAVTRRLRKGVGVVLAIIQEESVVRLTS